MGRPISYPDRDTSKTQVEGIENLATMNEKPDAVTPSSEETLEEGSVETTHPSFEEKTFAEKKLVRKIDLYLMHTIWILYCFSYMVCCSNSSQQERKRLTDITPGPHSHRQRQSRRHGRTSQPHIRGLLPRHRHLPNRLCVLPSPLKVPPPIPHLTLIHRNMILSRTRPSL